MGPSRNLILARLEGGPLATTGVIAGMSGSPVYIDGRLVGAVSYSLGAVLARADRRHHADRRDGRRDAQHQPLGPSAPARARELSLPLSSASLAATLQQVFARTSPFAESPADVRFAGAAPASSGGAELGAMLRPIATPLVMGGFRGEVADLVSSGVCRSGFPPMTGRRRRRPSRSPAGTRQLAPGDAVGVGLVGGDLSLGATGTVTTVDGDRVYAFGHPFYNLGPTTFPMTRAWVHTCCRA